MQAMLGLAVLSLSLLRAGLSRSKLIVKKQNGLFQDYNLKNPVKLNLSLFPLHRSSVNQVI